MSPPRPRPSSLSLLAPVVVTSGVSSPGSTQSLQGCCCPVVTRLPRPLPGGTPVGFPPLQKPCGPPLIPTPGESWVVAQHSRGFAGTFSLLPPCLPLCASLAPWRNRASALLSAADGAFLVSPLLARASPCSSPAPFSCVLHAVAIRVSLNHSNPPAFVSSFSVANSSDSSVFSPLHSSLALLLPSCLSPLTWCSPLSPSLLTCSCSWHLFHAPAPLPSPPFVRHPHPLLCLAARLPCSVPIPPSFSGAYPPLLPQALAATCPAPCAPSPSPGRQYFPKG